MIAKSKKYIGVVFTFCIIFNFFIGIFGNVIYAETNKKYGNGETNVEFNDDTATADNNSLTGLLAICIVTVGRLIASVTAWVLGMFMPNSEFPWADKIIFNTIPVLDVNFINPAVGSLMRDSEGYTAIGNVIRNVYFTGLSIALGFMGIVVAVMAIRLAISSIASEKARYKEAIVTWITALVLLFGTHFLLSFIFYLNEKLVEVASDIVMDATKDTEITIGNTTAGEAQQVVSSLGEYFYTDAIGDVGEGFFGALFTLSEAKPIPAVLYTVLVIQSLMFLFAYFKRFFYVIVLSVLAPFVIIYDFFVKSI